MHLITVFSVILYTLNPSYNFPVKGSWKQLNIQIDEFKLTKEFVKWVYFPNFQGGNFRE